MLPLPPALWWLLQLFISLELYSHAKTLFHYGMPHSTTPLEAFIIPIFISLFIATVPTFNYIIFCTQSMMLTRTFIIGILFVILLHYAQNYIHKSILYFWDGLTYFQTSYYSWYTAYLLWVTITLCFPAYSPVTCFLLLIIFHNHLY